MLVVLRPIIYLVPRPHFNVHFAQHCMLSHDFRRHEAPRRVNGRGCGKRRQDNRCETIAVRARSSTTQAHTVDDCAELLKQALRLDVSELAPNYAREVA